MTKIGTLENENNNMNKKLESFQNDIKSYIENTANYYYLLSIIHLLIKK